MTSNHEMTIPKSRAEVIIDFLITGVVVLFAVIGLMNLYNRIALVVSCIWLALVAVTLWKMAKRDGGLLTCLKNWLGELVGRRFVESTSHDANLREIRFGFELFGHRFVQQVIPLHRIESVEWMTGQATDMAGRDMNDWQVCLWYDHNDPMKSKTRHRWYRKPDQDIYIVGPSARKSRTAALGMSFVDFLRASGANLIQGATDTCFLRDKPKAQSTESTQKPTPPNGGSDASVGNKETTDGLSPAS